ncbi:hypothetical protein AsAng_0005160 [Aureispira anguillae]|uniref:Uncharacterized protein n=1 Tax=Aureispira anguillae TaxID=2864201 RepID=A0A915YB34_9BACT|nr:hypothetical protein AsAng_0005160 [Aureispira anguillae]
MFKFYLQAVMLLSLDNAAISLKKSFTRHQNQIIFVKTVGFEEHKI